LNPHVATFVFVINATPIWMYPMFGLMPW
jgi:hypothetical protein